jgi:NAD-dependent SIR2 family protein deacetylase
MIFEIIRTAKVSQQNIDRMTQYLNSLKESIVNLQSYYQMLELQCEEIMQDSDK